jgi:hypothetical protein
MKNLSIMIGLDHPSTVAGIEQSRRGKVLVDDG